jgi:hypothetical protein
MLSFAFLRGIAGATAVLSQAELGLSLTKENVGFIVI